MRISRVGQPKVAAVHGRVDGLLHGPEQHGVNLQGVRPVFGGECNLLKLARSRIVTDGHAKPQRLQVVAQHVFFLGRRAFMHTKQTNMFAVSDEICRANIRSQHGFFNQAVRDIARARYYFFNPSRFVANNLGFCGFKIHRTTNATLLEQCLVDVVQVQQMRNQRFGLSSLGAAGVGQNGCDVGIGKTGMAEHHCRIKLISVHFTFGVNQHVANHAQTFNIRIERAQPV